MSSNDTGLEETSPYGEITNAKRRRIAFSCLDCRRRKLKCDRVLPSCSRCQKGGHPETCSYDAEAIESSQARPSVDGGLPAHEPSLVRAFGGPPAVPRLPSVARSFVDDDKGEVSYRSPPEGISARLHAQERHIHELENRIIGLERLVNRSQLHPYKESERLRPVQGSGLERAEEVIKESMIFRGKSFKTQFYGATFDGSYFSHLPELRMFMEQMIVQHPRLAHVQKQLRKTKVKGAGQEETIPLSDQSLSSLLPSRKVVDRLVQVYVNNLEITYRILHLPSFWEEYARYWSAPEQGRPAFVVLLLLMLATTHCMDEKDPSMFRGESSLGRETAIMWIRNSDLWIQSQSQKHTDITFFQLHCLSYIAKRINAVKRKRRWTAAGSLVRIAMSAGLHRDGHIVNVRHADRNTKKVSSFDQEMRRRIWATISELETLASFERGMPAMTRDVVEDCGPPLNIEDEDFSSTSTELPEPKPLSEFTRTSYQQYSHLWRPLRLELQSLFNGPGSRMSYESILLYDRKIMEILRDLPYWKSREGSIVRIALQVQLQQLLLFLHKPYARDEALDSRFEYSATVHLRSAMTIIDLYSQTSNTGNSFLFLFGDNILGASLAICYNLSISDPNRDRKNLAYQISNHIIGDPLACLEKSISMTEDKIARLGFGLQVYHCLCAIVGLLKKQMFPDQCNGEEQRSAERVSQNIQKVLALQDNYSAAATLASLPSMPVTSSNGLLNGLAKNASIEQSGLLEDYGQGFEGLDLTNIDGWDLDTFWDF